MTRAVQLYTFKNYCDDSPLEKEILECGAGIYSTEYEPLFVRFADAGYKVHGIDHAPEWLENARDYCEQHAVTANLREADILDLPFEDDSISFVYSYNAIFHARKAEMKKMVAEMARVLKLGGLCFVNFLSVDDDGCGVGEEIGPGEFERAEHGDEKVLHAFLGDNEAETYFQGMDVLYREKRLLRRLFEDGWYQQAYIDYILKKI